MKSKSYGFKIGKHIIDIRSYSEQEAFRLLGVNFWHLIDYYEKVELLGELKGEINGNNGTNLFIDELETEQEK